MQGQWRDRATRLPDGMQSGIRFTWKGSGAALRLTAAGRHRPPGADRQRPRALRAEDPLSRRHHARDFRAARLIARLAALVPKPRAHLTRYHGVFAPASPDRARIVPGTRTGPANQASQPARVSAADRQRGLTWARRLKRVFAIDIETCPQCGGRLRVIASIEEPAVIERILGHLGRADHPLDPAHPSRAPPGRPRLI